ncbi:hypothetical protein AT251_07800 [Enterovibrio nigricans]|nr:hypothetical protein [Enterovibrio nigricans]PKF50914.1 hypothetical protein AT251_07800 [Enterovibrio nigricans]
MKSLSYTDIIESDSTGTDMLSLTLVNKDGIFNEDWFPQEGDELKPGISWKDDQGNEYQWLFGKFTIDEVTFKLSPDEVTIGASAKPIERGKLENVQSKKFENITFTALMKQLASECGLGYVQGIVSNDFLFESTQQRNESAQAYIDRLVNETNIPVSIKSNKLVVGEFEDSVLEIDLRNRDVITNAVLPMSKRGTFSAVEIEYYDQLSQETVVYRAGDASLSGDKVKKLYNISNINSIDAARQYAESYLQDGDKKQSIRQNASGRLNLINTVARAGQTIRLLNSGKIANQWKATTVNTSITGDRWSTNIQMKRAGS